MNTYDLMPGGQACVRLAEIKDNDRVLIITDKPPLAEAICAAIKERKFQCQSLIIYIPPSLRPMKSLPNCYKKAILEADIIFNIIDDIIEESIFRKSIVSLAPTNGGRKIFHMVSVNESMFLGNGALALSDEEFTQMSDLTQKLAIVLTMARTVRINSAIYEDTHLEIELNGFENPAIVSTGSLTKGSWGNLPSGEAFILPGNAKDGGKIVIDGAISYMRPLVHPVRLTIFNNRICVLEKSKKNEVKNELEFKKLLKNIQDNATQEERPDNLKCLAEFGIGTNIKAGLTEILEIEKIMGTIHIAIGDNTMFGGSIGAPNHIDMVVKRPIVTIDEKHRIVDGGFIDNPMISNYFLIDHNLFPSEIPLDHTIKVKDLKSVISRQKSLDRCWRDYRGKDYCCQIGESKTSEKVNVLWKYLEIGSPMKVKNLINRLQKDKSFDQRTICQLINVLVRYNVIDIIPSLGKDGIRI